MYENLSQKIKRYVKIVTIIIMVLVLLGGIAAAFILIRRGGQISTFVGIAMIFVAAISDILIYVCSLFAYGFGEMLEQQATQINLSRQILNAKRDANAAAQDKPAGAPSIPSRQHAPSAPAYSGGYPTYGSAPQRTYPYPQQQEPAWQQPKYQPESTWQPKQPPYGQYPGSYRTQNPYGTSTGFNEDYHYEPKR